MNIHERRTGAIKKNIQRTNKNFCSSRDSKVSSWLFCFCLGHRKLQDNIPTKS